MGRGNFGGKHGDLMVTVERERGREVGHSPLLEQELVHCRPNVVL